MQLVPLRLVFGIEPFNALFADAVSSHDVIVQLAAAGFVAVVSAPSSLRVERHPHGLFREPRVGRQPELHRVPTRRRDTRRRRVGRYRCAGDDPAVGLYKLNAADPSLERRLVSTIVPIK